MQTTLFQSKKWQKLQDDLGETSHFQKTKTFQYLAIEKNTPCGKYLYLPYGPCFNDQSGFEDAIADLKKLASKTKAFFIRIEPQNLIIDDYLQKTSKIQKLSLKKTKDLNPGDTWILDLTADKAQIISDFAQGTRRGYNQFAKKGISVEVTKDPDAIKNLVNLQRLLAKRKNINSVPESYLRTEYAQDFATLYLAKYTPENESERVIAAAFIFDNDGTRYYMQGASDNNYRKLPGMVSIFTTAIFDAKEKGFKNFDFWGIAPENAPKNHPWAGFTQFKKSFGGAPAHYCGTYDLIASKTKYRLYAILRKINRLLRKGK